MRKCFILILAICFSLLLCSNSLSFLALEPPHTFKTNETDAFFTALSDDEIGKCAAAWYAEFVKDEDFNIAEPSFLSKYPFMESGTNTWGEFYVAYDKFRELGYIPLPQVEKIAEIELIWNFKDHPFLLQYTCQTEKGEIAIAFPFKPEHTTFSLHETYEEWQQVSDRYAVSHVDMPHGKGVFSLRSYGSSCQSCMGSITGKGYANLLTEYEDFTVEVSFLYQTDQKEAIAFLENLAIEKWML